ncbi:MAG: HAMP domain-containing sensor histidine kinase [Candidatus Absconditabacterales bacterium]
MNNSRKNSIIYKIAFSFSLMSLITLRLLSGISYFFLSSQYTRNIKISLINQVQALQDEIASDGSQNPIEEQIPTLTNEGFLVFISNSDQSFSYHEKEVPFMKNGFYNIGGESGKILFYMNTIKGKNIFLGKKTDDFEKTRNDFIVILLIINVVFVIILITLSLILSKKTLKPITKLSRYLSGYRFNSSKPQKLYQDGQLFEIGILTKAFDTAIHYTQQSLQKEKEFLQDASHELRTPLMGISSSIELLQTENLTSQQQQKIKVIQLLSNKLQRITDELLFLTRGESQECTNKKIKLGAEIKTIVDGYEEKIKQKNIQIIVQLDTNYSISASEIHIQKLFSNLIDNAIKYTPEGGIITLSLHDNIFSIQDTGIGMSETFISRLGERFIREEQATKVNYEGVGLGLSIVHKICEIYGWKINIQSKQGKGTTISIAFVNTNFDTKQS